MHEVVSYPAEVPPPPPTLNYADPRPRKSFPPTPRETAAFISTGVYVAVLVFLTWTLASLRTTSFGTTPRAILSYLLIGALFAGLPAMIAVLTARRRRTRLILLTLLAAPATLAEGWASAEEAVILARHGRAPAAPVLVDRAWPFGHHYVFYEPGHGWDGGC